MAGQADGFPAVSQWRHLWRHGLVLENDCKFFRGTFDAKEDAARDELIPQSNFRGIWSKNLYHLDMWLRALPDTTVHHNA